MWRAPVVNANSTLQAALKLSIFKPFQFSAAALHFVFPHAAAYPDNPPQRKSDHRPSVLRAARGRYPHAYFEHIQVHPTSAAKVATAELLHSVWPYLNTDLVFTGVLWHGPKPNFVYRKMVSHMLDVRTMTHACASVWRECSLACEGVMTA